MAMADNLPKVFAAEDFNPERFVKELSAQCIGADELRQQRAKIQELANNTSAQLKRNVYQNYMQFIETAKEISHLESEMYQLSQLLSEQRALLSTLGSTRTTGVVFEDLSESQQENSADSISKEEEQKQKLIQLIENVEGALSLAETPGRVCLHEGSLLELDPIEGTPLKRIHAYLFNDVLMVASWLANGGRRGPPRYKMQAVYNLESLAIVNVRDHGTVKLAFKLLAFSDTRVFQCATATSKKEWLDKCEQAKRAKLAEENLVNVPENNKHSKKEDKEAPSRSMSLESNTLGMEDDDDLEYKTPPEWVLEVAEDLDSCIAQRHFNEAYVLLEKAKDYLRDVQSTPLLMEIQTKVNERGCSLVNVLTKELELSAEARSLQGGGLRSARRAVKLLIQLNRSAQACQLYLQLCSAVLRARLDRIRQDGTIVAYVKQHSAIAFSNIVEIAREFLKTFPKSTNCTSGLVVWCSQEIKYLTLHLSQLLFVPQVTLSTLVECIVAVRSHCDQLIQLGMDFRFQLDGQLRSPLIKTIKAVGKDSLDTVKRHIAEDNWRPTNLETSQNLQKLLTELDDLGISVPSLQTNDCWIPLTYNTITFAKLYVRLLEDCLSIVTPELITTIDDVLVFVMRVEVQHLIVSLTDPKLKQERKLVQNNAAYVRDVVIVRGLELYKSATNLKFTKLLALKEQIVFESLSPTKPRPAPRTSVPKYSTTEYL
ncbi:PREDICTED: exocyst complex component 8 isoform X2 [Cyphomyrmex costatus]|uniref:exocyst complex component 8 isoform X2 n=1 Tax=Cyphomyrmex costatus TaxID=456900 RepID=UPI00085235DB|nr:PREDICTED: exocyst complex component 8 isoform X2 [Cyphomyrmex costatus]